MLTIVLYTTAGCHLCEEAKLLLEPLCLRVEEVDIAGDDRLRQRYCDAREPEPLSPLRPGRDHLQNKLDAVYQVSKKTWLTDHLPEDADGGELASDGRVMEILSEHTLEGWLEGYLLTGRHGFFSTYEAFAHIIDSMFSQHANKSPTVTRIYLPPDVNTLLSVADHCLKSSNDVIVADKQKHLQYLDMDAAIKHCTKGIGLWDWTSNDEGRSRM